MYGVHQDHYREEIAFAPNDSHLLQIRSNGTTPTLINTMVVESRILDRHDEFCGLLLTILRWTLFTIPAASLVLSKTIEIL